MNTCSTCKKWLIRQENHYENGEVIVKWSAKKETGKCSHLDVITKPDFGCNAYQEGGPLVKIRHKVGESWQHKVHGPCPECKKPNCGYPDCHYEHCPGMDKCTGVGASLSGREDVRCRGTGKVWYYDDGYIGENSTQRHPREQQLRKEGRFKAVEEVQSSCHKCGKNIEDDWNICPKCGFRLKESDDTIVISDKEGLGGTL